MDENVLIQNVDRGDSGWTAVVELGSQSDESSTFNVSVDDDYYEELTEGKVGVERLIEESFKFLLSREPVDSILPNFDLDVIGTYFNDYEEVIKTKLDH